MITLFTTIKLYQYGHGTEHTAKTPLENEPILNPEVFREGNPNVELALNVHEKLPPIEEHPQLGIFNASKTYSLPPDTFFPYVGAIEILPLDDYLEQLKNNNAIKSAVKICQLKKNDQIYIVISNHEIKGNQVYCSKLDFCNSSFTKEEMETNKQLIDIGPPNAMFTQVETNRGIKGGIRITEEVGPGEEILVPGNIKY